MLVTGSTNHPGRDAYHAGMLRYVVQHHGVRADAGVVSDGDATQNLCTGTKVHMPAHDW